MSEKSRSENIVPEDENTSIRESGVSNFVGFDPEDEESLKKFLKNRFLSGGELEAIKGYEREKTEEEKELINGILTKLPEFIKKWGGKPLNINEKNIHFLDEKKVNEGKNEKIQRGGYTFGSELMYLVESGNKLKDALTILHELIHFNSFQSAQPKSSQEKTFLTRRIGIGIYSRKRERSFFEGMNEAITVELEKRFEAEYFESMPTISEEAQKRNQIKKEIVENGYGGDDIAVILGRGEDSWHCEHYPYAKERSKLWEIIEKVLQENPEQFKSKEDVFAVFAKASLSGKLLEVARLISKKDKDEFRKLGEDF